MAATRAGVACAVDEAGGEGGAARAAGAVGGGTEHRVQLVRFQAGAAVAEGADAAGCRGGFAALSPLP